MDQTDKWELAAQLEGVILRGPAGAEVARIVSAEVKKAGQELWLELEEDGAERTQLWAVQTRQLVRMAGGTLAVDRIRSAIADPYTREHPARGGGARYGNPVSGGSPGPGDPDLDL